MLTDKLGRKIEAGDIVVFTAAGAGKNLPPLKFGEVISMTKAGITLRYLDNNLNRVQVEEKVEDRSVPPYWTGHDGTAYYHYVGTGKYIDKEPDNIRWYEDRFYIIRKI